MLKQYIGPDRTEVVINGTTYGEVDPGDKLVVPDDVASVAKWPENLWRDVKPAKPKTGVKEENKESD
jgi:hypothetical protein